VNEPEMKHLSAIETFLNRFVKEAPIPSGVKISEVYTDEERPVLYDKDYLGKPTSVSVSQGAFHEKKEKNKKVNLGGPGERKPRKENPVNRGVLRKRAAKRK
jgi:ATP-dependent RNA helicase RhlE